MPRTDTQYGRIESTHPKLVPVVASEIASAMLKEPRHVDFVVTYSSLGEWIHRKLRSLKKLEMLLLLKCYCTNVGSRL